MEAPDRIFVSRHPGGRRSCSNGDRVEALFEGLGYAVVYPEDQSTVVALDWAAIQERSDEYTDLWTRVVGG